MASLAPTDSQSLCTLLSMFASALHGAVDAGASSCLYHLDDSSFDRAAFLERGYGLRLRALLPAIRAANGGKLPSKLASDLQAFLGALAGLGDYAGMSNAALADTVETITARFYDLRMAIASIARRNEIRVKFLESLTPEDEDYHMNALASIYGRVRQARDGCEPAGV